MSLNSSRSAGSSGQRSNSKRSFNSNSSNSNSKKKQQQTAANQKTLGAFSFDAYHTVVEKGAIPSSVGGYCYVVVSTSGLGNTDIMPSSLSQVDTSVLQQLPQELRVDILGQLPAHRKNDVSSSASMGAPAEKPPELLGPSNKDHSGPSDPALDDKLWIGSPPGWVDEFKSGKCMVLNVFAELYYKSGSSQNLSTILRNTILES
ncbi:hypothetical protein ACFX2I_003312 [Malus domestica]